MVNIKFEDTRWVSIMTVGKSITSRKALAIPVTYLILFVSMLGVISLTYGFAITSLNSKASYINVLIARQNMYVLDDSMLSVAWSPGASRTVYMADCDGILQIQPKSKGLTLKISDGISFSDVIFNDYVGSVSYLLGASSQSFEGLYLRGDKRVIVNGNTYTTTRLHFIRGDNGRPQLVLTYRPMVIATCLRMDNGEPLNLIRVHVLSLKSSEPLEINGNIYLRIIALNVTSYSRKYILNAGVSSLTIEALIDDSRGAIQLPIVNSENGAIASLDVLIAHVKVQRVTP